jgi:hypothetical protein
MRAVADILAAEDSCALAVMAAADKATDGACFVWGTDTVLVHLEAEGYSLHPATLEKLVAMLAVRANPAHLWDASVFKSLCEVLNGYSATPDTYGACSVGEAAWAVVELSRLSDMYDSATSPQYGDEPSTYVAAVAATDGYVLLPPELLFAADHLSMMPSCGEEEGLRGSVTSALASGDPDSLNEECPIEVHVAKLREVASYVASRRRLLDQQLASITP